MKWFGGGRRARKIEKELGTALWRQAHDRYLRGIDRYHQILEGVEDDLLHNQLVVVGDELAEQLPRIYALCKRAHEQFPTSGMNVPRGASVLHSALSRAANHVATTAEAEAMVRLQHGELDAVRRRADQVLQCIAEAESALSAEDG